MSGQVLPLQGAWQRSSAVADRKRAEKELAEIQEKENQKTLAKKRQQLISEVDPSVAHVAKLDVTGMSEGEAQAALEQSLDDFAEICALRNQPLSEDHSLLLAEYCKAQGLDVFSPWVLQTAYDALVAHGVIEKPAPKPTEQPEVTQPSTEDKLQADANVLKFLDSNRTDDYQSEEKRAVVDEWVRHAFGVVAHEFFKQATATRNFCLSESDFHLLQNFMRTRNLSFADKAHLDKACRALFADSYLTPREKKIRTLDQRMEKLDSRSATYHEDFKAIRRAYAELDREEAQ